MLRPLFITVLTVAAFGAALTLFVTFSLTADWLILVISSVLSCDAYYIAKNYARISTVPLLMATFVYMFYFLQQYLSKRCSKKWTTVEFLFYTFLVLLLAYFTCIFHEAVKLGAEVFCRV